MTPVIKNLERAFPLSTKSQYKSPLACAMVSLGPIMPLEFQIIRANEFMRMGADRHLDMAASKRVLKSLAKALQKRGIDRALMDLRQTPVPDKPVFTPTQIALLVDIFKEAGFREDQRLAVLYRADPHHGARLFALISSLRGRQVCAFEDFETALEWLSAEFV